ncbi:MAG: CDP-glucose 4,6-dehydratase, partial [Sedimenticola sp.]
GNNANWGLDGGDHPHEANHLRLDCSKAHSRLNWQPKWNLRQALLKIVEWHKSGCTNSSSKEVCLAQISEYMSKV